MFVSAVVTYLHSRLRLLTQAHCCLQFELSALVIPALNKHTVLTYELPPDYALATAIAEMLRGKAEKHIESKKKN